MTPLVLTAIAINGPRGLPPEVAFILAGSAILWDLTFFVFLRGRR